MFALKKSRQTFSSQEERKAGKVKKRSKIRANFQSEERFKEAFVCLRTSANEFLSYYIVEVTSGKD